MSTQKTKLAIIGAGLIGKRHIEAIAESQKAAVACVVDPNEESTSLAASLDVAWYPDIESMLEKQTPAGAIIATPNQLHEENSIECIEAGIPILVEKPISDQVQSAKNIIICADKNNVPVLVGHHRRHNPIIAAAKHRIDSGEIGDIVSAQATCWLYKPDDYFNMAWRVNAGGGPVFINAIHDIDLLRHFIGEVTAVQAIKSNIRRGNKVEDTAAAVLQFQSGALATLTVSDTIVAPWSWELTAAENPAYPKTDEACYLIGGTHGSIEIPSRKVWHNGEVRSWWEPIDSSPYEVDVRDPLPIQLDHFCNVIAGKEQPLVSGLEGMKTLQVIEAINQSSKTGKLEVVTAFGL